MLQTLVGSLVGCAGHRLSRKLVELSVDSLSVDTHDWWLCCKKVDDEVSRTMLDGFVDCTPKKKDSAAHHDCQ